MKRTILLAALLLLVSTTAAVVGGPEPDDGEMAIMGSGSSASASTAVGPNGTEWSSTVKMQGRNPNISIGEKLVNVSYSGNTTTFDGYIQAPTPCHVIDQETQETGVDSYSMNIETVKENQSQACVQQVVMIEYSGEFGAEAPYSLEIQYNNQTIKTLSNENSGEPGGDDQNSDTGFLGGFLTLLANLF